MCNYSEAVITLIYAWNWTTNWMKRNTKQRSSHCQLLRWWLQFSRLKLPWPIQWKNSSLIIRQAIFEKQNKTKQDTHKKCTQRDRERDLNYRHNMISLLEFTPLTLKVESKSYCYFSCCFLILRLLLFIQQLIERQWMCFKSGSF